MKKIIWIFLFAFILLNANTAEAVTFTLTVPDAKVSRVTDAIIGLYGPIPDADGDGKPDFTNAAFAKEVLRLWVINSVRRWESAEAGRIAREGVLPDDGIAQ